MAVQGALRQLQGVAGGGAQARVGQSMRTGHEAATTCSRCACFAAMQAANGQSLAETDSCRETITVVIPAGWRACFAAMQATNGQSQAETDSR